MIKKSLAELANIAKKNIETLNESIFEKIIFSAFIRSIKSSDYKFGSQIYNGKGYLDFIIYFGERVDIYELKFKKKGTFDNVN